jgi:ACS family sodium-dependent inorganic phosphate cotransporter
MSVAIIPMAAEFGWSASTAGAVQAAFFAGYLATQIPGGYASARVGGATTLPLGVALWSAATAAVPAGAGAGLPLLLAARVAVGAGEGLAPAAATDMIARLVHPAERARAVSFVYGGLHAGSLIGLLAAPPLIATFGWRSVFYGFGAVGLVWTAYFNTVLAGVENADPGAAAALRGTAAAPGAAPGALPPPVPWRAFLRSTPVRALAFTHLANNWLHYVLMAWLPSYFRATLSLSLDQAAAVSLLPPAAALAVATVAGPAADALLAAGVGLATARKLAQGAAFLAPAACLAAAGTVARGDGPATVACITGALGLSSLSLAGLYCNHADLSPRHAPLLLGGTTAVGALPGIVGVAATGALLDATGGNWEAAMFAPTVALLLVGAGVFWVFGEAEEQTWEDDGPFAVEIWWARARGGGEKSD